MNTYKKASQAKNFVLSAELPLHPNMGAADVIRVAEVLATCVDGIVLSDNQYGQTHMSPTTAASLLLGAGIDPIVQLCCRNRNRTALVSELLGVRAIGVTSVMLIKGNRVPSEMTPKPRSVLDMQAQELIGTAQTINEDEDLAGDGFLIVAAGTVHDPEPGWKPDELRGKSSAGAHVIFTQLCFDVDILKRYMAHLVSHKLVQNMSFVISLGTLPSADAARWLRDNRRRALIPPDIIQRLEQAVDAEAEGIAICSELLQQYAEIPGVSGVNLMSPGPQETIAAAVQASGVS